MTQNEDPPSDRPGPRELEADAGVDPSEDWTEGLGNREEGTGVAAPPPDFDEIIRLYGRRLYVLAYRLNGNRAEAEDLSQETLVRAYMTIGGFRGDASLYTYLYRALLNLWKNQIRSRRRWRFVPLPGGRRGERGEGEIQEPPDGSPGPHERLVGQEQAERLRRALLEIEPEFRTVLVLRVAEGLEYEEIAAALGIRVGTVRSRLARARGKIRELMRR